MGTLRFFEEVVSFKIRRTFGFADYTFRWKGLGVRLFSARSCQGGIVFIGNEPGSYFRNPEILFTFVGKNRRDGDSCGRACTIPACKN